MLTVAYCAASFARSVQKASGVEPLLCPPLTTKSFPVHKLEVAQFLYFKLHGLPDQPYWYGDDWVTALSVEQLTAVSLKDAVVFVANCYLPESPMLEALLKAGAAAVVGGSGPNFAKTGEVYGADLLGYWFRRLTALGVVPKYALMGAKSRLRFEAKKDKSILDALGFKLWTN